MRPDGGERFGTLRRRVGGVLITVGVEAIIVLSVIAFGVLASILIIAFV
jgi:hypothetical protein